MMNNEDFQAFYENYYRFSIMSASKVVKDDCLAEDISQDVFCILYQNRHKLDRSNELKLKSLVVRASENKAKDYLRKAYLKHEIAAMENTFNDEMEDKQHNVENQMLSMEEKSYLKILFQNLKDYNPISYEVFIKVIILDTPPESVAEEYHTTANNVNNRILRTRSWLRKEYARIYKK
jgi:RNA polymerase sigma-70 factor (ECF subfamily)